MSTAVRSPSVRAPAVAGLFYPADRKRLTATVESMLGRSLPPARAPRALIVPHAGYIYSGVVAGHAYALLEKSGRTLRRIVLLGPSHHERFEGLALPAAQAFATPLGEMPVDAAAVRKLRALPRVIVSPSAHAFEHSLEVQLPFLERLAPAAAIVPILTGEASPAEVAEAITSVWDGPETLVVVSSDLSHYHPYAEARERDAATARAIVSGAESLTGDQACGCIAVNGLNHAARGLKLSAELLDLRNSGDTAGDKRRVVGYGAFGYFDA